jgi:protein subunit release factor A
MTHQNKGIIMKKLIEIRQAEGGQDSALFVRDLARAYVRMGTRLG